MPRVEPPLDGQNVAAPRAGQFEEATFWRSSCRELELPCLRKGLVVWVLGPEGCEWHLEDGRAGWRR